MNEEKLSWKWEDYFSYWDKFLRAWCEHAEKGGGNPYPQDGLTPDIADFFNESVPEKKRLVYDELPEPYYGNPTNAKCVIIQMNPGGSDNGVCGERNLSNEATKKLSNKGNEHAFLIRSFLGIDNSDVNCGQSYSMYAKNWSPLRDDFPNGIKGREVCGYEWWHSDNHRGWIKRFTGAELSDVFVLELCPYHSIRKGFTINGEESGYYILNKVVAPAAMAAGKGGYVICLDASVRNFIKEKLGAELIATWENGWFWEGDDVNKRSLIEGWPQHTHKANVNAKYVNHKYVLFRLDDVPEGGSDLFLYVSANQMRLPSEKMNTVESQIKEYIKHLRQSQ